MPAGYYPHYSSAFKREAKVATWFPWLIRVVDIDAQVEACRRVFASDMQWTVERDGDLAEGESQGRWLHVQAQKPQPLNSIPRAAVLAYTVIRWLFKSSSRRCGTPCSNSANRISRLLAHHRWAHFADQYLFNPLGISNAKWDTDAEGISIGGWGLRLTPRDMAKLGYLYLRNGQWDGQQIVSAQWVEDATRTHTDTAGKLGYGYQWWTYPALAGYTPLGRDGQTIFVIPELDLIVVTTAETNGHDQIFQLVEQYVLPAVKE